MVWISTVGNLHLRSVRIWHEVRTKESRQDDDDLSLGLLAQM
jgi:hypothetical protein